MEKEKNDRKIIIRSMGMMLGLVLLLLGGTFALWFITRTQEGINRISALDCLDISLTGNESINLERSFPISNAEGMQLTPHSFTVRNECDTFIEVDIVLAVLSETTMLPEYVRVSLQRNNNTSDNSFLLSTRNIITPTVLDGAISRELETEIILGPNQIMERDLRIWMDEPVLFEQANGMEFNSRIVIVARPGIERTPTLGEWTPRQATEANEWQSVTYGNGLFVAVSGDGTNRVMTSHDGINWTARQAAGNGSWQSVTYGNGLFVAVSQWGSHAIMTSPDGITWTVRSSAPPAHWISITYGNGMFVAVGINSNIMTSSDGITWTVRTIIEQNTWFSVTYGNGIFVAISPSGTHRLATSLDGITWTSHTSPSEIGWSVTYGNGVFVSLSTNNNNRVMSSLDGITWTVHTAPVSITWNSVTYGNGLFVAVSSFGTNQVMTSPDGITWTVRQAAQANLWTSVTYGNGLFVAVSRDGTDRIMTAPLIWE